MRACLGRFFSRGYFGRRFVFRGAMGLAMSLTVAYLNLLRLLKTDEAQKQQAKQPAAKVRQAA